MTMVPVREMALGLLTQLQAERERQGISKSEMARRLGGIGRRSNFSTMEDGYHFPTFVRLIEWCAALGGRLCFEHETPRQKSEIPGRVTVMSGGDFREEVKALVLRANNDPALLGNILVEIGMDIGADSSWMDGEAEDLTAGALE